MEDPDTKLTGEELEFILPHQHFQDWNLNCLPNFYLSLIYFIYVICKEYARFLKWIRDFFWCPVEKGISGAGVDGVIYIN